MKQTLISLLVMFSVGAQAQVFPIQVHPQLTPPYSPYLSSYTASGAQNFIVQIRTNDVSVTNYPCKLRITIEGVGITLRTKENFVPHPLVLSGGGLPEIFYGDDLWEYFHPDALDFTGLTRSEYQKSKKLPEGVYRFTVEVQDYHRGTVVSNKGTAMAWIVLNDPPLLNLPSNFSRLKVQDATNILFTWTPRHTGSPNAAFTTEYIFRLTEIWPENRNPYDAFLTQRPLYEITLTQNQILYGLAEPALIAGRKYAWQVEARDTGGKDLFKNNGQSEVFVFQYGEALAIPRNLQMRWAKPTTLAIRWDPIDDDGEEVRYRLQYRPRKRREDHQWYETRTKFTDKTLYDLQANTEYEMKVRAETIARESEYTETLIFKTLRQKLDSFVCKVDVAPPLIPENTLPVFPLAVNDTIHAGGYNVLVRDVIEMGGKYYGAGLAVVPWLNGAKVRVTFEKIGVNDRFWLTSGTIKSVWNAQSNSRVETETQVTFGNAPQTAESDHIDIALADTLIAIDGKAIAAVTKDETGNIVVTTTDGGQQTLTKGNAYAIADEVGNGYVVDKQGKITKTTSAEAKAAVERRNDSTSSKGSQDFEAQLVKEFFEDIARQISDAIGSYQPSFPRGAGPMMDLFTRSKLPGCMPEDHEKLAVIRNYLNKTATADSLFHAFTAKVFENIENKETIVSLANQANPNNRRYQDLLTDEDYKKVEAIICPYIIEGARQDYGKIWWRSPLWERAANTLAKHFRRAGLSATVVCESKACTTVAEFSLSAEVTSSFEIRFGSEQDHEQTAEILSHYGIDALRILDATEEDFIEWWWNWMALQDARIYEREHGGVAVIEFIADVVTAPTLYPAISGWVTGTHWRDGRELTGWEHALAALDFLVAEEIVKGCITNFVVRVGKNSVNLFRLSEGNKYLLKKSVQDGLKFSVVADDEIAILTKEGNLVGRIVNNVLTVKYEKFGGDIVCDASKTTTVIGRFEDLVDGHGITAIKENKLYKYGENVGGINILDDGEWSWPVNEAWLTEVVKRNDVIRLISDPNKIENIYIFKDGKQTDEFTNFGKEINFLQLRGYRIHDNLVIPN